MLHTTLNKLKDALQRLSVLRKVTKGLADLSFCIRLVNENYNNFYIQTQILSLLHL